MRRLMLRTLLALTLLLLVLPAVLVLIGRWVPVTVTSFMLQGRWHDLVDGEPHPTFARRWVAYEDIPQSLKQAVIAAEDQGFAEHSGFDFHALQAALRYNERHHRVRGGSTISQQLAKNLFLWPGRSYLRKGLEAYYTVLLEALWPKRRILEVYLNVVELGDKTYGAAAGAERSFNKPLARISRHEAALLAACLPAPRLYSAARPGPYLERRASHIEMQLEALPAALQ